MLQLRIACVGSLKEAYWRQAVAEYEKRLTGRCKLTIAETPEERLPASPSPAQTEAAMAAEAARLLPGFSAAALRVALCVEGRAMTSEQLAETLGDAMVRGASSAAFAIGGPFGLHESVKQAATLRLSLSAMTLPHQLARVVLLEQLYRAFSILEGAKYHK